jgi:hypothetical protein
VKSKFCHECKPYFSYVKLFSKLSLDDALSLKERGAKAKEVLMELYFTQRLSSLDIQRDYKVNVNTLDKFSKKAGFQLRSISEGISVGFAEGRMTLGENPLSHFKQGWHTSWEGGKFYFRSSYELDLCHELDQKMVSYSMESLRIPYFDSQKQKMRVALPDFHLSDSNEILEVKSLYFFNKVNIQDKFREYVRLGYRCKLILEHKEYSVDQVLAM